MLLEKKILLILVLVLLASSTAFSQYGKEKYYGGIGLAFQFPQCTELNSLLHVYNSQPNAGEKFKDFGLVYGPGFVVGTNFFHDRSITVLEFGFSLMFSNTKTGTKIPTAGAKTTTEINIRFPMVYVGGMYLIKGDKFNYGGALFLDLGSVIILGRTYQAINKPSLEQIGDNYLFSSVGVWPKFVLNYKVSKSVRLSVRPGYYFTLVGQNIASLNTFLNPGIPPDQVNNAKFSGPSIELNALIYFALQ